jgi:hypothetical protein
MPLFEHLIFTTVVFMWVIIRIRQSRPSSHWIRIKPCTMVYVITILNKLFRMCVCLCIELTPKFNIINVANTSLIATLKPKLHSSSALRDNIVLCWYVSDWLSLIFHSWSTSCCLLAHCIIFNPILFSIRNCYKSNTWTSQVTQIIQYKILNKTILYNNHTKPYKNIKYMDLLLKNRLQKNSFNV